MLYAGAKELMRNTAEVGKIIEIDSAEDLEDIEAKLKGVKGSLDQAAQKYKPLESKLRNTQLSPAEVDIPAK